MLQMLSVNVGVAVVGRIFKPSTGLIIIIIIIIIILTYLLNYSMEQSPS